jgi:hypothetical protein
MLQALILLLTYPIALFWPKHGDQKSIGKPKQFRADYLSINCAQISIEKSKVGWGER